MHTEAFKNKKWLELDWITDDEGDDSTYYT